MLKQFGDELWIADGGDIVAALGFHYPTRMAVIAIPDGGLFVWSPVELTGRLRAAVDALGEVRYLVAPNALHHVFMADWKRAYPEAGIYAAPGLRKKRADLAFESELTNQPPAAWVAEIDQVLMEGNRITTEAVFFHRRTRTVLFTDLLQQLPDGWYSGWRAFVARWDLMVAAEPSVPRKFRLAFTDRPAARAALRQILAWPAENVIMAHGTPIKGGGSASIERAFGWLSA